MRDKIHNNREAVNVQCQNFGIIFTGPTYKLSLSVTVISDVYMSFIPNKNYIFKPLKSTE